jgi:hypothetical protein
MKTISINDPTHKELKALCKTYKITIVEFMQYGVLYFKQTGINPEQVPSESPQKAIKELGKRVEQIIGVIKAQEQDKINPLLEKIMMLVRRAELILNDAPKEATFKTVLSHTEEMMDTDQKHHVEQLKAQHKYHKEQLDILQKNHEQTNSNSLKKMEEIMTKLDKMTVAINRLDTKH